MRPAQPNELAAEIGKLFAAYPSFRPDASQIRVTIAAFIEQVEGLPLWAVEYARKKTVAKGGSFLPSAGEFAETCRNSLPQVKEPIAKPPGPAVSRDSEMSRRVGTLMHDLSKQLAAVSDDPDIKRRGDMRAPEDIRKAADARLAELHAERHKPIKLSSEALSHLPPDMSEREI